MLTLSNASHSDLIRVLAVDPGPEMSAFVDYTGRRSGGGSPGVLHEFAKIPNEDIRRLLRTYHEKVSQPILAIEMIASYGMPVGAEVFETCVWIGRFEEAWQPFPVSRVYRREVKMHVCSSSKAKDGNVRAALMDRFGGKNSIQAPKKNKSGCREAGPLHGVTADIWAALGVAITFVENYKDKEVPDGSR